MQNMKTITFSVIIATYNAVDSLQKTLNSIKNQTYTNYELIIIDGNSTDKTIEIIIKNKEIISYWISESDGGLYDAWNKGIEASTGNWITFLGAGDILDSNALLLYKEFIDSSTDILDYISAKIRRTDENGNFISILGKAWSWNKFKNSMTVAHVGSIHNRNLFSEIGTYNNSEYPICADYELLLRKKDRLKTGFLDMEIGEMPIGGVSFSVRALKESAKAKYKTGGVSIFNVIGSYFYYWFLFNSFKLRHFTF